MSRARAILLVAMRELTERARTRAFVAGLVVTELFVIAGLFVPGLLGPDGGAAKLGYVGDPPAELRDALMAAARPLDVAVELTGYPDLAAGEAALEAETISGLIVPPDVAGGAQGAGELVVRERPDGRTLAIVQSAYAILGQANLPPLPSVRALEPQTAADDTAFLIANVGVVLLFISIFTFGYWVLSGVIEEKQSRVVEVILSTVNPRDLLVGKVLGIGVLGLGQLLVMVVTAVVGAQLTGRFELPATTGPAIAMVLLWFAIGYALYSTMFAVLGALASRMEDASNATMPVSLLATASYIVGLLVVPTDPDGLIARVATFFPPSAPMIVPLRTTFGAIEIWEAALAAVIAIAATWALFVLGGRVYSGAVLRTSGRTRLRDAWRAAGQ